MVHTHIRLLVLAGTKKRSRRRKEAAGGSGAVVTDIVNPTPLLPTTDGLVNNETGLPQGPILPDEPRVEIPEDQDMRDREEDAESSHADDHDDQVGRTVGGGTGPEAIVVEPSLKNVLDAMKTMGDQLIALTQTFTPLVNSSVGQANPPARVATRTAGTRVRHTADVVNYSSNIMSKIA
ncbi:hypothetical protein Bca4012_092571 [Brassica carinata]